MTLDEVLAKLAGKSLQELQDLINTATQATKDRVWVPNPGPQTEAFFSPADEIFYGGQAGGGKSDLEIGLALTAHQSSLLLRRTNKEADGLVERIAQILGTRDGWHGQAGVWRYGTRNISIGGCQLEEDKQKRKGIPNDLICFDEVSDFSETQYTFIIGWNRSATPGQRCRVVAAGNPPTRPEGLWVIKRWAAWLDPQHHNPARPGELRWYTTGADGKEVEVEGRGPHTINGESVCAKSRTFIPAKLSDNPELAATNYAATLAALPEELRAAYKDGFFGAALQDDPYQTIPTAWVREAQARWTRVPPVGVPMCAIGVDIAQGGKDNTVLAIRHDGWYAPMVKTPGRDTPDGQSVAGLVVKHRRDGAKVIIDLGGGVGGDALICLKDNGIDAVAYMGIKKSPRRTENRAYAFSNVRSEAYWRFREALDPSQPQGSTIALPQSASMVADLCAPTYSITSHGIVVESKESVCDRLRRSTDEGDAVVMAWFDGITRTNIKGGDWLKHKQRPNVGIMGRGPRR